MSLFDSHVVDVQPRKPVRGDYGTSYEPYGPLVRDVVCGLRFLNSTVTTFEGVVVSVNARVLARSWPGDEYAQVVIAGSKYDTTVAPIRRDGSRATAHWEVLLSKAAPGAR